MKKYLTIKNTLLICVILLASLLVVVKSKSDLKTFNYPLETSEKEGYAKVYTTRNDEQGEVEIEVTPLVLGSEQDNEFMLGLSTHSVDLSYDFKKIISIKDDQGEEYQARSWDGGNSGHHLRGKIIFPPVNDGAQEIELLIKDVDGIDRVMKWEI